MSTTLPLDALTLDDASRFELAVQFAKRVATVHVVRGVEGWWSAWRVVGSGEYLCPDGKWRCASARQIAVFASAQEAWAAVLAWGSERASLGEVGQ